MKIQCENIGNKNVWKKNCPKCGREQVYTSKYTLKYSIVKNTCCNNCLGTNKKIIIPDGGWKKLCPKCGKEQIYSCKSTLTTSVKKNTLCNICRRSERKIIHPTNGYIRKCKNCGKDIRYSCRGSFILCEKNNTICVKCATKESKKYINRSFQKTKGYRKMMSKKLKSARKLSKKYNSEECREKLRIAKLNQIKKLGTQYNYNPVACKFIENFGKKNGYNFQHALNGGEVIVSGYSLDGYDKDKNVVFEYDEPKHNCISVKKNDQIRENRIIEKIKPKIFIRYNEEDNELYDVISKKEIL